MRSAEAFLGELTAAAERLVDRHPDALRSLYREAPGRWIDARTLGVLGDLGDLGVLGDAPPFTADVRVCWLPCPAEDTDPGVGWAVLLFYVPVLHAVAQVALHQRARLLS